MSFCLDDGAELLYGPASGSGDEPQTAILPQTVQPAESATRAEVYATDRTDFPPSGATELSKPLTISRRQILAPIALAIIILGGFYAYQYLSPANGQIDSIAVLPFTNATGDREADFLAEGIAETLINDFTKIPELKVTARSTALRFRGREGDPRTVGKELGVGSMLTGRVTQRGEDISIQVDLINASDGTQIWGHRYEGNLIDLVNIQRRMVSDVSQR